MTSFSSIVSSSAKPSSRQPRALLYIWQLLQALVLCAFALQAIAIVGSWLVNGAPQRSDAVLVWLAGSVMVLYTMLVSCLIDVGNPRYRSPVDGILLVTTLVGLTIWRSEHKRRRMTRGLGGHRK